MMDAAVLARVLDAAEELIGDRGFFRVTLDEVAERSGADGQAVRDEFGDVERLLVRLAQERGHELRSQLHRAVEGLSSRAMMEGAGFEAFFHWLSEHPRIYRVLRQAELVDSEVFRDWYRDLASDYVRGLMRSMEEGEIQALDPETLAWCLMGMGDFLGMRYILWDERDDLPRDVARTFQRLVTRMLTGSSAGR